MATANTNSEIAKVAMKSRSNRIRIVAVLTTSMLFAACNDTKPKRKIEDCSVTFRPVRSDDIARPGEAYRPYPEDTMFAPSDEKALEVMADNSRGTWNSIGVNFAGVVEMNGHGYGDQINTVLAAYDSDVRVTISPFFGVLCSREKIVRFMSDEFPRAEQHALRASPRAFSQRAQQWRWPVDSTANMQWLGQALVTEYLPQLPFMKEASSGKPLAAVSTCDVSLHLLEQGASALYDADGAHSCSGYWCEQLLDGVVAADSRDMLNSNLARLKIALEETEAGMFTPHVATSLYAQDLLSAVLAEAGIDGHVEVELARRCNVGSAQEALFGVLAKSLWEQYGSQRGYRKENEVMPLAAINLSVRDLRPAVERALKGAAARNVPLFTLRGGTYEITPTTETTGVATLPAPEPD